MTPTNSTPETSPRRDGIRWCLLIFACALCVRGATLWQLGGSPLFDTIMGDAVNYDTWARRIAGGDWLGSEVFYQAPLYPYFLATLYSVVGEDLLVVRGFQILLGALSCALLAQAGRRYFSKSVGIGAGLLLAVYAPAIFADVSIQKSVLDIFLVCLLLWILSGIDEGSGAIRPLGLGSSLGVLILSRENALVFVPVLVAWLLLHPRFRRRQRLSCAALFTTGITLVLLPVAVRNWVVGGEFHLTTSQFGHNFYIGNNEAADGTYTPLLQGRGDPRIERQDAIRLAEDASGRKLTPAEVSNFYFRLGLRYIRSQPLDWIGLMARKFALTFNAIELVDTKDQYSHAELSSVLRVAGWVTHFGILAPLAILGVWVTWADRSKLLPLYFLCLSYAATLLIFYAFARYRIPLIPFLALFASAGVVRLRRFTRAAAPPRIAAGAIATLAVAVFCNWPIFDKGYMSSVTHYNLGNELVAAGKVEQAMRQYRKAIRLHEGNAKANHNLGALLAEQGDLARAKPHFEEALRIDPDYAQAHFNLARTLYEMGDPRAAIQSYQRGLRFEPRRADIYNALGLVYEEIGEPAQAIASFEHATRLDPSHEEARQNLLRARDGGDTGEP